MAVEKIFVAVFLETGIEGLSEWSELPHASSLCGACRDVCPVRLDIPRMLLSLRRQAAEQNTQPVSLKLAMKSFAWAASKPRVYRGLAKRTRGWLRMLSRDGWIVKLPGPAGRWTQSRDLKAPPAKTFQQLWSERRD